MTAAPAARFGVVGSGWRTRFFLRLARMAPEHLVVTGVVTRTAERGAQVTGEWGTPTFRTVADLLAAGRPEFVVASVPWAVTPETTREAVGLGLPVLAETPPAPTAEGLRQLWDAVGASGQVQVAEQYLLMPGHAARLRLVREGVIGEPTSVQVSSTHLYHATSMIRHLLGVGFGVGFGPVTVTAQTFHAPLVNPLTPDGWTAAEEPEELATTLATLDFGDGRCGLYDFTDNQWWNPLRARRIVVRGSHGEIVDDSVVRLADPRTAVESRLLRRQLGIDLNLEGVDLAHISFDGRVLYRNPFPGARFSDDDLAVATLLRDTAAWVRGAGPQPYPLAEGCQDHLLGLAIEEAARTGAPVTTQRERWAP
ncbi:MAG TPA: Gfo/Idh/MocA family oxidoreductase [Micromonosporaceae bacterium]|nr:Gfo/Idh/MocA family oxidoreductase [Micromonosporaceae bacterium]